MTATENELINRAYLLDENLLEPVYILRPIDPSEREDWRDIEEQATQLLRRVSDVCFKENTITKNERDEYYISVTAKEIYRALENNKESSQRMAIFYREIEDIQASSFNLKSKFIDTNSETEELFNDLKNTINNQIPAENQFIYKVHWTDQSNRMEYLRKFQDDFYAALKRQIDYHMSQAGPKDALYNEILEHAIQCRILNERYFPRDDIVDKIKAFVLSSSTSVCSIYGKSGTGKSSIMAQIVMKVIQVYSNNIISSFY